MATYIIKEPDASKPGATIPGVYTYNGQRDLYELVTTDIDGFIDAVYRHTLGRVETLVATVTAMLEVEG